MGAFYANDFQILLCVVIVVFPSRGERDFSRRLDASTAASCNRVCISPMLLRPLSPYCDTSRVPNMVLYRLEQLSRTTKPPIGTAVSCDSSNSEVI